MWDLVLCSKQDNFILKWNFMGVSTFFIVASLAIDIDVLYTSYLIDLVRLFL